MKSIFKPLLVCAVLASAGVAAVAQGGAQAGPGQPMTHRGHMDPAKMQETMAKRQAELKAKLQLSAAQEGAWSNFIAALQPSGDLATRMNPDNRAKMHEEMQRLTTPERIDRMSAMKAQRDAAMAKRGEATKAFYAALTPEQQRVFDANTMRGRGGRHGGPGKPSQSS